MRALIYAPPTYARAVEQHEGDIHDLVTEKRSTQQVEAAIRILGGRKTTPPSSMRSIDVLATNNYEEALNWVASTTEGIVIGHYELLKETLPEKGSIDIPLFRQARNKGLATVLASSSFQYNFRDNPRGSIPAITKESPFPDVLDIVEATRYYPVSAIMRVVEPTPEYCADVYAPNIAECIAKWDSLTLPPLRNLPETHVPKLWIVTGPRAGKKDTVLNILIDNIQLDRLLGYRLLRAHKSRPTRVEEAMVTNRGMTGLGRGGIEELMAIEPNGTRLEIQLPEEEEKELLFILPTETGYTYFGSLATDARIYFEAKARKMPVRLLVLSGNVHDIAEDRLRRKITAIGPNAQLTILPEDIEKRWELYKRAARTEIRGLNDFTQNMREQLGAKNVRTFYTSLGGDEGEPMPHDMLLALKESKKLINRANLTLLGARQLFQWMLDDARKPKRGSRKRNASNTRTEPSSR